MSFNRLNYDTGAYTQDLKQSTGPGKYILSSHNLCNPCYPYPPTVRLQKQGNSLDASKSLIDIDSELLGLRHKHSKDPKKNYKPVCPTKVCTSGQLCGQGVIGKCQSKKYKLKDGERYVDHNLQHLKNCFVPAEQTRTTNPACNLRGTGFDRWEWLCLNPQEKVTIPFDYNISSRTVIRDNHRPCIPNPIEYKFPNGGQLPCENTVSVCVTKTN